MTEYKIQLEQFQGPLDLLLRLIEEEQLNISEISLARVADQFIKYVNEAQELNPGEVADFLVVASKLLLIKSRLLLPSLDIQDEDEGSLERQLKIYKEYYEASKKIRRLLHQNHFMFSRSKPIRVFTPKFAPPKHLTMAKMAEIFAAAVKRLEPVVNLPQDVIKKTITITDKILHIKEMILQKISFGFKNLLRRGDKVEVIVSFLAVLELVKQRTIEVNQGGLFSEITVERIKENS